MWRRGAGGAANRAVLPLGLGVSHRGELVRQHPLQGCTQGAQGSERAGCGPEGLCKMGKTQARDLGSNASVVAVGLVQGAEASKFVSSWLFHICLQASGNVNSWCGLKSLTDVSSDRPVPLAKPSKRLFQ